MLFLRGLWWRRGYAAAILLIGVISTAVAAIGPLYARASAESGLTDSLNQAGYHSGLSFTAESYVGDTTALHDMTQLLGRTEHIHGYGTPIEGRELFATGRAPGASSSTGTTLASRTDVCRHVVIVTGHCPTGTGQTMVDANTLDDAPHWRFGETLTVHEGISTQDGIEDGQLLKPLRIVGIYRPRDIEEPYWFSNPLFVARLGPSVSGAGIHLADPMFVTESEFHQKLPIENPPIVLVDQLEIDLPLRPSQIRLDDLPRLSQDVRAAQRKFPKMAGDSDQPQLYTDLFSVLAAADRDKHDVDRATVVVVLELAVFSLLVLFQVVGGAVAARGDEIALAKLRGLPPWRTVVFALREPLTLLALATPIGLGVGYAIATALSSSALAAGTPVSLRGPTWLAVLAALVGAVVAAGLGAARTITRPVLEQWRNTSPVRRGRWAIAAFELVLAAAAVFALVEARRSGGTDHEQTRYLVAPALLLLAIALVGVRVLPLLGRLGLGPTRATRRIGTFLALRQTVRRPGGLRLAALLAVAAGLATFALCGEAVAHANRVARAQTELGVPTQLSVQFAASHDPEVAVERADPSGRWAMAVADWVPDGGLEPTAAVIGHLLAVDPARLAAITYPVRGQTSPRQIARDIQSTAAPIVSFHGDRLSVTLDATTVAGSHPTVLLLYEQAHQEVSSVPAGALRLGRHTYSVAADCAYGCTFEGITLDNSIDADAAPHGVVAITSVTARNGTVTRPLPVRLNTATAWRSAELGYGAHTTFTARDGAIVASYRTDSASSPTFAYADSPAVLPLVAAPAALTETLPNGQVADYSETAYPYRLTRVIDPLPVMLDKGAMAGLHFLRVRLPRFDQEATWSVWLGPRAPADAVALLKRDGLIVQSSSTESQRLALLSRQGPALGLLLLLVCAVAAAVLAVGGTAVSVLADARRRTFELAALNVVGVRRRVLRRAAVAEQALLLGAGILLGVPGGYLAAYVMLPVIPEFSDHTPVVQLFGPSVGIALLCAASLGVLMGITAVIAGRALVRAAVPSRLREVAR